MVSVVSFDPLESSFRCFKSLLKPFALWQKWNGPPNPNHHWSDFKSANFDFNFRRDATATPITPAILFPPLPCTGHSCDDHYPPISCTSNFCFPSGKSSASKRAQRTLGRGQKGSFMLPLYGEGRGPFLEEKVENEGVDVWERENVMAFEMRSQVHYPQICIAPSAAGRSLCNQGSPSS